MRLISGLRFKYFAAILGIGLFLGSPFLLLTFKAGAESNLDSRWFSLPEKILVDTSNNLLYVLNRNDFVTILDATDYSLVKKIEIKRPLDFYIDNSSKKIYITEVSAPSKLIILNLLDKNSLKPLSSSEILEKGLKIDLPSGDWPVKIFVNQQKQKIYLLLNKESQNKLLVIDSKDYKITNTLHFVSKIYPTFKAAYDSNHDKIYLMARRGGALLIIDPSNSKIVSFGKGNYWLDFALNDKGRKIYALGGDRNVAVMNGDTGEISFNITLEKSSHRIFYDSSIDKILITSWDGDDIKILNPTSLNTERVISLPRGASPESLMVNSPLDKIYVMNSGLNSFSVIDAASFQIQKTSPAPSGPVTELTINPVTQDLIMPSSWTFTNALFVIKPDTSTLLVPPNGNPISTNFLDVIWKIFSRKDDKDDIYILNNVGNFSKLTALNPVEHQILWTTSVGSNPKSLVIDYKRNYLYVMSPEANSISVINGENGKLIKVISIGGKPIMMTVNEDFSKIYVTNFTDDVVSIIDPKTNMVTGKVAIEPTPTHLFYDKKGKLLYVLGSKSVTVIDSNNQVASKIDLPPEVLGNNFFVGSSNLEKVYVIAFNGAICDIYKDGKEFKAKLIKPAQKEEISDVTINREEDKIYMANQRKMAIDVLDLNQDTIKASIGFDQAGTPIYLLGRSSHIFSMNKNIEGGYIGIINPQSAVLEDVISLMGQGRKELPADYFGWVFNIVLGQEGAGRGTYHEKSQKVYFPTTAPNPGAIAVFDVSQKSIIDVLTYDNLTTKKLNWNVIIGGSAILAALVGLIILIRLIRRKKSIIATPL